jgi:hypothetical protein
MTSAATPVTAEALPARRRVPSRLLRALAIAGVCLALCGAVFALWSWVAHPQITWTAVTPGTHITMASGISVTMSRDDVWASAADSIVTWHAGWLYRDDSAWTEQVSLAGAHRPVVVLLSCPGQPWAALARMHFAFEGGIPPLAYSSPDGHTRAYWQTGGRKLLVVSEVPGRSTGVIMLLGLPVTDGSPPTAGDANEILATVWRGLSIEGVTQPVVAQP